MKITIVDEKDKKIGVKQRENISSQEFYRVSALWITNSKGEILLAKRAYSKVNDPGKWGPAVAGTVEEGETYYSNIIKEMQEELGLKNVKPEKGPKTRTKGEHSHFTQWFFLKVDKKEEEFDIQKEEVAAIKWFSEEELKKELRESPENYLISLKCNLSILIKS